VGAAAEWISAASPRAILVLALIQLVTLSSVLLLPWLARRLQESSGYAEIDLKAVGFHLKISFTPENTPPSVGADLEAERQEGVHPPTGSADNLPDGGVSL
jgi:hypothetical protein